MATDAPQKPKTLNVIFKSDVTSSLEAIDMALKAIHSDEVSCRVLDYGVGNITEADVKTAASTQATIFGFRVKVDGSAINTAEKLGVPIATYDIIYELIEAVRQAMSKLLTPQVARIPLGKLKVLALFKKEGKAQILGGKVTSGKAVRGAMVDLVKGASTTKVGKLSQLQHNKEDVTEVREGLEAGLRLELSSDITVQAGDTLELYEEEIQQRTL